MGTSRGGGGVPSQDSLFGHHGHTSKNPLMTINLWAKDGPLIVVSVWILSPLNKKVKVGPPRTKLSGSTHVSHEPIILEPIMVIMAGNCKMLVRLQTGN